MRPFLPTRPLSVLAAAVLLAACGDASIDIPEDPATADLAALADLGTAANGRVKMEHGKGDHHGKHGMRRATVRELERAREATARYQRLDNALADGYADIDVFIPQMGYHYLKADVLDETFNPSRPELLVYWPDRHGRMHLVAVEYAVPLALSPDHPPEGFTGSADVWDRNETFQLWTLHAWVWLDNPDGVFAPFNPRLQ